MKNVKEYNQNVIGNLESLVEVLNYDIEDIGYQLENEERVEDNPQWAGSASAALRIKRRQAMRLNKAIIRRKHLMLHFSAKPKGKVEATDNIFQLQAKLCVLKKRIAPLNKMIINQRSEMSDYKARVIADYDRISKGDRAFIAEMKSHLNNLMGSECAKELFVEIGKKARLKAGEV